MPASVLMQAFDWNNPSLSSRTTAGAAAVLAILAKDAGVELPADAPGTPVDASRAGSGTNSIHAATNAIADGGPSSSHVMGTTPPAALASTSSSTPIPGPSTSTPATNPQPSTASGGSQAVATGGKVDDPPKPKSKRDQLRIIFSAHLRGLLGTLSMNFDGAVYLTDRFVVVYKLKDVPWSNWADKAYQHRFCLINWPTFTLPPGKGFDSKLLKTHELISMTPAALIRHLVTASKGIANGEDVELTIPDGFGVTKGNKIVYRDLKVIPWTAGV